MAKDKEHTSYREIYRNHHIIYKARQESKLTMNKASQRLNVRVGRLLDWETGAIGVTAEEATHIASAFHRK